MAGNLFVCFPNRIDGATLSGGAYVESLPLANLKERVLSRVARTIDATTGSTTFTVDFGRQRNIRIIALIAHNLSFAARLRIRASNAVDFSTTVYDETDDVWGAIVNAEWNIDELEWESDNYWLGTYTQEDTAGQTAVSPRVLPASVSARYWRFDIIDTQNDAGFIQIGRVFMGDAFLVPQYNYSYGASLGYETDTVVEKSLGGAEFFDPREPLRVMRFQLELMSHDEGFSQALELTRRAGIHKEVFVVADPDDTAYGPQRNFVGRMRALNSLEQTYFQLNSMSFEIKELR